MGWRVSVIGITFLGILYTYETMKLFYYVYVVLNIVLKILVVNVSYWCLMNNKIGFKPCAY